MSEFTFATLIKDTNIDDIKQKLTAVGINGYIFQANNFWTAIVSMGDMENGEDITKQVSQTLKCTAFYFINCEDHGWGYSLFKHGRLEAYLHVNYEADAKVDISEANIWKLKEICSDSASVEELERYLTSYANDLESVFIGVDLFKKAFDFIKVEWVSYEYFSGLSKSDLEKYGAVPLIKSKKSKGIKSIIRSVCENELGRSGYSYSEKYLKYGEYAFIKERNGFDQGLAIAVEKYKGVNLLAPVLKGPLCHSSHNNLYYLTEGYIKDFEYSNDFELESFLHEVISHFIKKGELWLKGHEVEYFDAVRVYNETVDMFFQEYSFKRVYMDTDLLRGKVVYQRGNSSVIFFHMKNEAGFKCEYYGENGECISLRSYILGYENISVPLEYRNEKDYMEILQMFLQGLKKYCL